MRSQLTNGFACAVAIAVSCSAFATTLDVDGVLLIKGLSMEGAQVIIVSSDGEPQFLTEGLARFALPLRLNTKYLLSFERPGCASKQLQFDTFLPSGHTPDENLAFPVQVTLEPIPAGQDFAYAGPVGFIHFDNTINAFSYATDHRIAEYKALSDRLELARTQIVTKPTAVMAPTDGRVSKLNKGDLVGRTGLPVKLPARSVYEVIAPMVSRTAPMVLLLETPAIKQNPLTPNTEPVHVSLSDNQVNRLGTEFLTPMSRTASGVLTASDDMTSYRYKDIETDRLHVITTIKVKEEQVKVEYRRVVSYYGAITYFRNGTPCSEASYRQGVDH